MIGFAALLERLPHDPAAWADYEATAKEADRAAAFALLSGQRPRRLVGLEALLAWSAEVAGVPPWLMEASLAACGDKAETAALLLPPPVGAPPGLAEVVSALERATRISAHAGMLALWSRLPAPGAVVVNRLASGTFRTRFPAAPAVDLAPVGPLRAVLVMADPVRGYVTLALWHQGVAVPVARAPLKGPDRADLMARVRTHATGRFGPLWQVPPLLVLELHCDGVVRNGRRKSGYHMVKPVAGPWLRDLPPEAADDIEALAPRAPAPTGS